MVLGADEVQEPVLEVELITAQLGRVQSLVLTSQGRLELLRDLLAGKNPLVGVCAVS